jgi:hypothetical protein
MFSSLAKKISSLLRRAHYTSKDEGKNNTRRLMAFKISFKINWTRRFFVSVLLRLGSTSAKSDIQLKKSAGAALHFKIIDCRPPSAGA